MNLKLLAFSSLVLLLCASFVCAQTETGQITGTVMDPSGSVVPTAKVTVKNIGTGAIRSLTTNNAGVYAATNLQPSKYEITVEFSGFSTARAQVEVSVGAKIGQDFTLQVGATGTVVEVSESSTTVNTETQTLGSTISTQQVIDLPTIGRDPYALVGTVGNVSDTSPDARGAGFAINGQRSSSTNVMLDGTSNNDEFGAGIGMHVPLDSVQEFSVLTSNFTAEFGRATGGVVNVVTKSGANQYRGSAYEFNRVSHLASNEYDNNANGIAKPVFARNQFGFSIGGPVLPKLKDKLFFFTNTEWTRIRSQAVSTVWVPTPAFIAASASNTQAIFSSYGKLRSGLVDLGALSKSQLLARSFDPCKGLASTSACALFPASTPMFDRVSYSRPSDSGAGTPQNQYSTVERIDYNLSPKTSMYVRYAHSNEIDQSGSISNSPYAGFDSPNTQANNSIVYSLTHTFSPTFISQSKVDFNRFNNQQPFGTGPAVPTLYLGSGSVATSILGNNVALPGYDPYTPGNSIPFGGPQNYVQLYQDFSNIWGKHSIRYGATVTYLRDNRTFGAYETAVEVLGLNVPKGIDNFLTGNAYSFQAAVYPQGKYPCGATVTSACTLTLPVSAPNFSRSNRYTDWGLYVQDAWKLTRRVTLNYGVRWERYGPQHNKDSKLDSNFFPGSGGTLIQQLAAGTVQTGKTWNAANGNFGPRVGAAWDVFGDGKTSLRGGYGVYYERNFGNVTFNIIQNPPNYAVVSLIAGQDVPSIPITSSNAGPLAGNTGSKALPKVSLRAVDPNIKTAYAHAWSGAIEHRFGEHILGAVEYSGSYGQNQYGIVNFNRAGSGPYYLGTPCTPGVSGDIGNCGDRLIPQQYSNINFRSNGGFDSYNSLTTRVDIQNMAHTGLNLRASYTWSHAIDTLSDTFSSSGNQANLGWLDPFNPNVDKGNAYYDLRQRFTLAGIWNVPFKSDNKLAKLIADGWAIAPLFTARTGTPFSLYDCTNAFTVCPYAAFNGKVASGSTGLTGTATPNVYSYINVASKVDSSFYNKKIGISDFGPYATNMIGRNFFTGPGFYNIDLAVYKSFKFGEVRRLQFRAESYNFLNHANLHANVGDNDVSSIDFVSASFQGRRQIQLGIRYDF